MGAFNGSWRMWCCFRWVYYWPSGAGSPPYENSASELECSLVARGRLQMSGEWTLTSEEFDDLLSWLDPNRERAGSRYEEIRAGLIKRFRWRGCSDAEDLADKTINRVVKKLPEIRATYKG